MSDHNQFTDTQFGAGLKTFGYYISGLIICVILTVVAFVLVHYRLLNDTGLYVWLTILAVAQLLTQVVCFLRLNTTNEGRWNLVSFVFTVLIIAIVVIGSLWIMYNLNYYMGH